MIAELAEPVRNLEELKKLKGSRVRTSIIWDFENREMIFNGGNGMYSFSVKYRDKTYIFETDKLGLLFYAKVADAENCALKYADGCNFEHLKNADICILDDRQKLKIFEAGELLLQKNQCNSLCRKFRLQKGEEFSCIQTSRMSKIAFLMGRTKQLEIRVGK